ncbi:sigma 54-interacting transcriptional regulator [Humidesulfovibrio idahonensis]
MAWGAYRAKAESEAANHYWASWSVRKKLLASLIPSILLILVVAGYVTNWFSTRYLNQALQRTAQVQNLAQAREVEALLEYYRLSLLNLTKQTPDREHLQHAIERWGVHHPGAVKELAFVGVNTADSVLLVQSDNGIVEIRHDQYAAIKGSPISQAQRIRGLKAGAMPFSDMTEAVYPQASLPNQMEPQTFVVFRLVTPVMDALGTLRGYLSLGIDARSLRNILSLYNSPKSPLYAFARTSETRFSYFFDDQGWILFQSENYEEGERELAVEVARLGMTGDYGLPDYDKAFRPLPKHESYWRMIVDVQSGRGGVNDVDLPSESVDLLSPNHFLVYAPVRFMENPDKGPTIIGGIAYVDRSRLTDAAEFRHLDVMLIITISGMGLVALVIFFVSRVITSPLHRLAAEIRIMFEEKTLRPIRLDSRDMESDLLARALNRMIMSIQDKQEQIRKRDEQIHLVQQREKVSFDNEIPASLGWRLVGEIPDLIGQSQPMATLQSLIRKAASTEADVLVVGETGTGKELTAEAIHKFSSRASKPFISINCGGLDENLLMDTLFGHVKGAFTEARTDRKGAFLASDGGTLFLDEIGTATPKVQKALLRALSVRRTRPLGSDQEIDFNVRVIAATNVDLMELVQRGEFRDDLYYRLKVIFIQTPPLRQRKEDIPILANHFLKELAASSGRPEVGLTRGALEKLMNHHWPGNVRELKNCITRGLAFADGDVLYAEDLIFDDATGLGHGGEAGQEPRSYVIPVQEGGSGSTAMPASSPQSEAPAGPKPLYGGGSGNGVAAGASFSGAGQDAEEVPPPPPTLAPRLAGAEEGTADKALGQHGGHRQQIALRLARERGSFSRLDYQQAVGAEISQRTAQYDLQTLVQNGRLRKTGKGPSTLYLLVER